MRLCRNKGLRRSLSFLRLEVWVDFRQLIFGDFPKTFDSRAIKIFQLSYSLKLADLCFGRAVSFLQVQKVCFCREAAGVAGQCVVVAYYPVAGREYGNGI